MRVVVPGDELPVIALAMGAISVTAQNRDAGVVGKRCFTEVLKLT